MSPHLYRSLQRRCLCRSYISLCRGGVCETDPCRRIYIGLCRGGVCAAVILVFAEEVSVRLIRVAAVILVFAEEVPV